MASEYLVVVDADDVVVIVLVPVFEVLQDFKFDAGLMLKALLVADDFDGYHLLLDVVEAFEGLAETTAANLVEHFIAICKVIFQHYQVVSSFVIVSKVVAIKIRAFDLGSCKSEEKNFRIILYLNFLIVSHSVGLELLKSVSVAHRKKRFLFNDSDRAGRLLWVGIILSVWTCRCLCLVLSRTSSCCRGRGLPFRVAHGVGHLLSATARDRVLELVAQLVDLSTLLR